MAMKATTDNLTLDAIDAERAGMSYGQYKAQHPKTRDANETRLAKRDNQQNRVFEFTCRCCGEKFTTTNSLRRYCGDSCRMKKSNANYRAKHAKKEMEVLL